MHEALEEEAVGEGLRPGQPQAVGDERVGRAPPACHGYAPLPCYLRRLAGEEEVRGEAELLYAPELALEPGAHPAFDVPVPLSCPQEREPGELPSSCLAPAQPGRWHLDLPSQVDGAGAALSHRGGVWRAPGPVAEDRFILARGLR